MGPRCISGSTKSGFGEGAEVEGDAYCLTRADVGIKIVLAAARDEPAMVRAGIEAIMVMIVKRM